MIQATVDECGDPPRILVELGVGELRVVADERDPIGVGGRDGVD